MLRLAQVQAGDNPANLAAMLDKAGSTFANRLKAVAVTLTHAVANRVTEAAAQAM